MSQPSYNRHHHKLAAYEEITIHNTGNLVSVLGSTAQIEISIGESGSFIPMNPGQTASFQDGDEFELIRVKDVSGAANEFDLYVGKGEFFDLRFSAQGVLETRTSTPDEMQEQAPVTVNNAANAQLLPANPRRKEAIIVNEGLGKVYVSTNPAAVAGQGVPLAGGQSLTLEQTSALHVRNDSGAAVNVSATDNGWSA